LKLDLDYLLAHKGSDPLIQPSALQTGVAAIDPIGDARHLAVNCLP